MPKDKAEYPRAILLNALVRLFEAELAEIERAHAESACALKIHLAARAAAVALREDLRASEAALKELTDKILAAQREGDEEAIHGLQEQQAKLSSARDQLRSELATAEEYAAAAATDEKRELDKLARVVHSAYSRVEKLRSAVEDALEMEQDRASERHNGEKETGTRRAGGVFGKIAQFAVSVIVLILILIGITVWGTTLAGQGSRDVQVPPDRTTSNAEAVQPVYQSRFIHRAASENISGSSTYLDHPLTNDNPDAVLLVAQNWNPEGSGGTDNNHPLGVWYDANRKKWAIFNQDRAAMPKGAAFNVLVINSSPSKSESG